MATTKARRRRAEATVGNEGQEKLNATMTATAKVDATTAEKGEGDDECEEGDRRCVCVN